MHAVLIFHGTRAELRPFAAAVSAVTYFKRLAYAALYAEWEGANPEPKARTHSLADVVEELERKGHKSWDLNTHVAAALTRHQEFQTGVRGAVLMRGAVFKWDSATYRCAYNLGRCSGAVTCQCDGGDGAASAAARAPPPPVYGTKRLRLEPVPVLVPV